jgi:hypothetical protein
MGIPNQAPPLARSEWVLAEKPDRLVRIVWNGLTGPISVERTQWNAKMPNIGREAKLSAEDIAALLNFIRCNNAWGNNASPVTADQVKSILESIADRQGAWKADESEVDGLLRIPVQ